ncbi:MAG: BtrH N-terminal domain-containing protein [Anaerolineae bacterium]
MTELHPLPGFRAEPTHHCVTGSMRLIYRYHGFDISEDMLLGLGAGVGFVYWHQKGMLPFLGGRGGFKPPLEETAGARTGVVIARHHTGSAARARKTLLELLGRGEPVMLMADMGYLPYFDFGGQDYHFGGHAVVACGYNAASDTVLIADRDGLHPVPMADLERARSSRHQPFPPHSVWFTFDFTGRRLPTATEIRKAIAEQVRANLQPPISNLGVCGIRTAAERIVRWPQVLDGEAMRTAAHNAEVMICARGGSGGGNFRYMLSRFLGEAAEATGDGSLARAGETFRGIGDRWEALAAAFRRVYKGVQPAAALAECRRVLLELAEAEQGAWQALRRPFGEGPAQQ